MAVVPAASGSALHSAKLRGSLVCVGLGMTLGAHMTPRSRSYIEQSDVVFLAVSDALVEVWVRQMHPDVRSLQVYYDQGKSRHLSYSQMVEAILTEVRAGKRVCGAFYGHPGVFALAPHQAVAQAREEGFEAAMEPGISAEDCLYADLGIDPGRFGCQHFEASQLMFYQRRLDPSAYLVLWQVGLAGDRSHQRFASGPAYLQLLVDLLAEDYPLDHSVVVYEAATLAISQPRMEHLALKDLVRATLHMQSTLIIPPCQPLLPNPRMHEQLDALDRQSGVARGQPQQEENST